MGQFGWYSVNAKRSIPILLGAMDGDSTWGGAFRTGGMNGKGQVGRNATK